VFIIFVAYGVWDHLNEERRALVSLQVPASPHSFRIESCLGRGGFGEVYLAVEQKEGGLESEVALKVLREGLDPAGQGLSRLRDEAKLLSRLNHPTIMKVFDLVLLDGRVSLVAEFVDGQDLERCLGATSGIPLRAMMEVVAQVAGGLHQAWAGRVVGHGAPLRLVHRDIKPSNIRIGKHGHVKLLDFGIARTDELQREADTRTDLLMGSPAYMAPERFSSSEIHPGSDVFSLGCTLYEALVGRRYYSGCPVIRMSAMSLHKPSYDEFMEEKLAQIPRKVPTEVVELLRATLNFEPDGRPSAEELMKVCETLADQLQGATLARWCRNRQWPVRRKINGPLSGKVLHDAGIQESGDLVAQAFLTPEDKGAKPLSERTTKQTKYPAKRMAGDPTLVSSAARAPSPEEEFPTPGLPFPISIMLLVVGIGFCLGALLLWL
jgi:serine/threonine protein kinase